MAIKAAKCPSCGANLNVDEGRKKAFCEYCGSPFIVEDAINNFIGNNTVNVGSVGTLNVNSDQTADARIEAGRAYLKMEKFLEAFDAFDEACKLKPHDFRGYWGKLKAITYNYASETAGKIVLSNIDEICSDCRGLVVFMPKDKQQIWFPKIRTYLLEAKENISSRLKQSNLILEDLEQKLDNNVSQIRITKIMKYLLFTVFVLCIVLSATSFFFLQLPFSFLAFVLGIIIAAIGIKYTNLLFERKDFSLQQAGKEITIEIRKEKQINKHFYNVIQEINDTIDELNQ